jgi:Ferredoxin
MAFASRVSALAGARVVETSHEPRIDLRALVRDAEPGTAIFACGPAGLLAELRDAVAHAEKPLDLRIEAFQSIDSGSQDYVDREFVVNLERQQKSLIVPPGQSILKTMRDAGYSVPSSCEDGWCGTCETPVRDGVIEHRDTVLSDDERDSGASMMVCVSRAQSDVLVLDF